MVGRLQIQSPQNGNHSWILDSIPHDQPEVIINALEHLKNEYFQPIQVLIQRCHLSVIETTSVLFQFHLLLVRLQADPLSLGCIHIVQHLNTKDIDEYQFSNDRFHFVKIGETAFPGRSPIPKGIIVC